MLSMGWWDAKYTKVARVEECWKMDKRPDLTFLKYKPSVNFSQLDSVMIVNAITVDFSVSSMQALNLD